jgi:hypothetical protein
MIRVAGHLQLQDVLRRLQPQVLVRLPHDGRRIVSRRCAVLAGVAASSWTSVR